MPSRVKKSRAPTGRITPWALAAKHRLAPIRPAHELGAGEWLLEVAWSGHRVVACRTGKHLGLYADDLREWTQPCAAIGLTLIDLPADDFVIEGFLCVLDARGCPDFAALKERVATGSGGALVLVAWDCLRLRGADLRAEPLRERRERLKELIPPKTNVVMSEELEGSLAHVLKTVKALGLPGVFARSASGEAMAISATGALLEVGRSLSAKPKVTRGEKVLFPRDGLTKTDLTAYYRDVAPVLLPLMRGRPVVAQRWPDGIDDFTWYQHRVPPRAPDYLKAIEIDGDRRLLIENDDALAWMVNQAALTFHGWLSRVGALDCPDWAMIDLDPGKDTTWPQVIDIALAVRAALEVLEVESLVKTSGQKGLHVLIPLAPGQSAAKAHAFAARVCTAVADVLPGHVCLKAEPGQRRGRLLLDHLQHFRGKSLVLPYAVRAVDGAPVSTPLRWDEVTPQLDPKAFTVKTLRRRLDAVGDLFVHALKGSLTV